MSTWILRAIALLPGAAVVMMAACARTGLPDADRYSAVDAGPLEDGGVPPPADAAPDGSTPGCDGKETTPIYVVTSESELLTFDPAESKFTSIGAIHCPDMDGAAPFSMAVDRKGKAYIVYSPDGSLYEVSTADASCKPTSFVPDQKGFNTFGLAFSTDEGGPEETLYGAESNFKEIPSKGLMSIDPKTFEMTYVAAFSPALGDAVELTGTGDGRLYGLFIDTAASQSHIALVDKKSGAVKSSLGLPLGQETNSFTFAFWGGDFYVFHAKWKEPTTVTKVKPGGGSPIDVATLPTHVVGTGVSTCAPKG